MRGLLVVAALCVALIHRAHAVSKCFCKAELYCTGQTTPFGSREVTSDTSAATVRTERERESGCVSYCACVRAHFCSQRMVPHSPPPSKKLWKEEMMVPWWRHERPEKGGGGGGREGCFKRLCVRVTPSLALPVAMPKHQYVTSAPPIRTSTSDSHTLP